MKVDLLLAHISLASVLLPLSLAIIQWNRLPKNLAPLRWLLISNATTDVAQLVTAMNGIHNKPIGDAYMLIQFTFLIYIFSIQFERKSTLKILYGVLVVLYAGGLIFLRQYPEVISILHALASLVLIIVSIQLFYEMLNEMKVEYIHRQPILWIALGVLFYYSGNLFVFIAQSYLLHKTAVFGSMWMLHNILNFIKNIFFAVALWQSYRTVKSLA